MKKPIVAIMYDFDKTLITRDMQEYTFIPSLGMQPDDFWDGTQKLAVEQQMDSVLATYVKLDEWCKSHSLASDNGKSKFRYGSAIITGRCCRPELRKGEFTFTEEEFNRADEVHAEMLEIIDILDLKGNGPWIESLAVSWVEVRKQHDFRLWIKELKAKKRRFLKSPKNNLGDWNKIFSQIHLAIDIKK